MPTPDYGFTHNWMDRLLRSPCAYSSIVSATASQMITQASTRMSQIVSARDGILRALKWSLMVGTWKFGTSAKWIPPVGIGLSYSVREVFVAKQSARAAGLPTPRPVC